VRHTYRDSSDEPRFFDPTRCEIHPFEPREISLGGRWRTVEERVFARLPGDQGIWLSADVYDCLPCAAKVWKRSGVRWIQTTLGKVADYFDEWRRPYPDSLVADIEASQGVIPEPIKTSLPRLTPAIVDILRTLAESKVRLTRERLLSAMTKAGRDRGVSTVADAMPILRKAGWVDNQQNGDPRGYAITKAGRSALKKHDSRCL
jgi:hypothetical protein